MRHISSEYSTASKATGWYWQRYADAWVSLRVSSARFAHGTVVWVEITWAMIELVTELHTRQLFTQLPKFFGEFGIYSSGKDTG